MSLSKSLIETPKHTSKNQIPSSLQDLQLPPHPATISKMIHEISRVKNLPIFLGNAINHASLNCNLWRTYPHFSYLIRGPP